MMLEKETRKLILSHASIKHLILGLLIVSKSQTKIG